MRRWIDDHKAGVAFVGSLVAGIALHVALDHGLGAQLASWGSTAYMLADSLAVGGFLGGTVDWFLKRALVRDVGSIFIGYALPQELRNQIREVSQTSIVRKNHHARYKLILDPDGGGGVIICVLLSTEIFNYSTGSRGYQPKLAIDLHDKPVENAVRCEVQRGDKVRYWTAEQLNQGKRVEKSSDVITWNVPVMKLPPQDLTNPQLVPACKVTWQFQTRMPIPFCLLAGNPLVPAALAPPAPELNFRHTWEYNRTSKSWLVFYENSRTPLPPVYTLVKY